MLTLKKIILIVIGFFLICLITIRLNLNSQNKLDKIGYDQKTLQLINQKLTDSEITDLKERKKINYLNIFIKEKYYLHKNLDRYLAYYTTHPEIEISKIISLVNVNADAIAYKNIKSADLSKGNLILVNKYNYLDSNYEPDNLIDLDLTYAYKKRQTIEEVKNAFIKMYNDAKKNNIDLFIASAYRSYEYQKNLYTNYVLTYGQEYTDTISAQPGFSEHQTGLALDIITYNQPMSNFKYTKAYQWLKNNSYKYGFILRYPENKEDITGYAFESWHYRYVGIKVAQEIFDANITFDEYYAFYIKKY